MLWGKFARYYGVDQNISAVVVYGTAGDLVTPVTLPMLCHLVGDAKADSHDPHAKVYTYQTVKSPSFVIPCQSTFDGTTEAIAHTRNLTFLKKHIRGLDFDLEAIWEEHTFFEFAVRSVPKTMATMVQEPYVNHITTV